MIESAICKAQDEARAGVLAALSRLQRDPSSWNASGGPDSLTADRTSPDLYTEALAKLGFWPALPRFEVQSVNMMLSRIELLAAELGRRDVVREDDRREIRAGLLNIARNMRYARFGLDTLDWSSWLK